MPNPIQNLLSHDREVSIAEVTHIMNGANLRREIAKVTPPELTSTRGMSTFADVSADVVMEQNNELLLPSRHGHGVAATIIYEPDAFSGGDAASSRKDAN